MEVLKMLHGAQGAVWLCLVRIPISATRLENTNPADNSEQQKKTINKTIREKEKKTTEIQTYDGHLHTPKPEGQ